MKTRAFYPAWAVVITTLSAFSALAEPVDAGTSEEAKEKAALHARIYNQQSLDAFRACRGRPAGVECSYALPSLDGISPGKRVEGTCWAPENPTRKPQVCR